ncbi:MAG: AsmA family protein [Alphaproteobacteria bacterium]|nr:AsmA family protein [Alphaproteobacteria bacterium]
MKTFFKIIFSLFLIIIVGVIAGVWYFLNNFDLNQYKGLIEEQTYKYTGRQLKINGDAHLGISLVPTLIVDDITLSNAAWAEKPNMAEIKNLSIQIAVMPLFEKKLVINDFTLNEAKIYLEKAATGMANWDFTRPNQETALTQTLGFAQLEETSSFPKPEQTSDSFLPDFLNEITIKNIGIDNGFIEYNDASSKQNHELTINTFDFNMDSLNSPVNAVIDAVYQNEPIKADLKLGSVNDFLANTKPFPVNIAADAYKVKALVEGTVFDLMGDNLSYDLSTDATSANGAFDLPSITFKGKVKGDLSKISANIEHLNIVNNTISGTLKADISKKIPQINADLKSPKIDLRSFQKKKTAFDFELISSAQASSLVPNTPVPYDLLQAFNGLIKLNIKKLIIDDAMTANNVALKAAFVNGTVNVKPLDLDFGNGHINLDATINSKNKTVTVLLNSKDILIQDLHKEFLLEGEGDFGVLSGGKTLLNANLSSQGATYRQLVQNMKGQAVVLLTASKFQTGSLQFLTKGFIRQLLSALNIKTNKTSKVNLQCAAIRTDIAGGKADFPQGIAIQSDKFTLSSTGKINLINDKIDFSLAPSFNFDTGIAQALSSFIKVKGTLNQPQIAIDDKQTLKAAVGIATTGGLGYLGAQTLTSDNSPCYSALKGTAYQSMVPQPSAASQAQQNTVQNAKEVYKEGKAAVKEELKNLEKNAKDIINMFKRKK